MQNLCVTTVQSSLHWEDKVQNLTMFDQKLQGLVGQTDLIILPEMFTTGFSMNAEGLAESMDGTTMQWLSQQAATTQAVITGSFIAMENGQYFNRLVWMQPDGNYQTYDKRHLFTLAGEQNHYSGGTERLIVEYKGWRICPLVCYDLRFPVWSRNTEHYDLLIYVANFPARRSHAWKSLLVARAIENQAYTIGLNRVGTDENGIYYSGDSVVLDYEGQMRYQISHTEDVFTTSLSYTDLQHFRSKLNFLPDQDRFEIL